MEQKNLQLERLVFFSDAVVAIAITLLALEIKIDPPRSGHLRFADIGDHWRTFAGFGLSFFNIAIFWARHHTFFIYINRIDERLLWYNILWLLFIVLLPFSTALMSTYFADTPAMVIYSGCILLIAIWQNAIWDYASGKGYLDLEKTSAQADQSIRTFCNLEMTNSSISLIVAFFSPLIAFLLLTTKVLFFVLFRQYWNRAGRFKQRPAS